MQSPYKILVTRSEQNNQGFIQKCKLKNLLAFSIAGVSYIPSQTLHGSLTLLGYIKNHNWIFVSPRSVEYFFQDKLAKEVIKSAEKVFAIGSTTAEVLRPFLPKQKVIYPEVSSSESFLLLRELQVVTGGIYYVVRAQSGRCLIRDTLIKRGAEVNYIESYQTIFASKKESFKMVDIIHKERIDCIVFTSFAIFKHIIEHVTSKQLKVLLSTAITVVNKRMLDWAIEQGFVNIIMLQKINNDAIIEAVIQHVKEE